MTKMHIEIDTTTTLVKLRELQDALEDVRLAAETFNLLSRKYLGGADTERLIRCVVKQELGCA